MKLITDSDLSEEDSLTVLQENRRVFEDVEDIDLIRDYLREKAKEKRTI